MIPRHRSTHSKPAQGFTLIEVLVAVVIFTLLAAAAYTSIDTLLRTRALLHERAQKLQSLQTTLSRLERDLRQSMAAPVRAEYGDSIPALRGTPALLELTRSGYANPLGQNRARIERVQWVLRDDVLNRVTFPVLDRAINTQPIITPMMPEVTRFTLSYFDGTQWQNQWPRSNSPDQSNAPLPSAVAISLETKAYGALRRVVPLVEPSVLQVPQPSEDDGVGRTVPTGALR